MSFAMFQGILYLCKCLVSHVLCYALCLMVCAVLHGVLCLVLFLMSHDLFYASWYLMSGAVPHGVSCFRFEALIEREWIQAGHPFRHRCAKSAYAISKQRHESPVFLLFVDCVWQVGC